MLSANPDDLTVNEARELLSRLLSRHLTRQRIQQLCELGDLDARWETRPVRVISRTSVERLAAAGLPDRRGRPRKDAAPGD
jgi:hypothetical protein